ncbi:esterase [filamentous cyanobacterium CCP5]|nr:esterase [filamentous cyanobacterium CCP5]
MPYLYLHGFASGPQSTKAQALKREFQAVGQTLIIPDLNQGDFTGLTLSRQLAQVKDILYTQETFQTAPWSIIGSSFGGLTAAWLGSDPSLTDRLHRLVLLAPAFQFLIQWLPRLGEPQLRHWQAQGYLSVYHHGLGKALPLAYDFVLDGKTYDDSQIQLAVPTLILHGQQDDVIDPQVSRDFASRHSQVQLIELASDHALANVQPEIWQAVRQFLAL